jgi:hypothetical protein
VLEVLEMLNSKIGGRFLIRGIVCCFMSPQQRGCGSNVLTLRWKKLRHNATTGALLFTKITSVRGRHPAPEMDLDITAIQCDRLSYKEG